MNYSESVNAAVDALATEGLKSFGDDFINFNVEGMNYHELKTLIISKFLTMFESSQESPKDMRVKIVAALSYLAIQNFVLEYRLQEAKNVNGCL